MSHIHIIGICGVASSGLAIALKESGYKITGSDKGFYPPVSTYLKNSGVEYYAGYHPEKMLADGNPDLVVVATAAGSHNPELLAAREAGIEIISEAEGRGRFFAEQNSIVTVGTWGKTTTSTLLAHIFTKAGLNPSYMTGGIPIDIPPASIGESSSNNPTDPNAFPPHQAKLGEGVPEGRGESLNTSHSPNPAPRWSILEGDEYKSAPWDDTAKFMYSKPTHLLLTSLSWDHADLYPTEDAYFNAFKELLAIMPESGLILSCIDNAGVRRLLGEVGNELKTPLLYYGANYHNDLQTEKQYTYHDVRHSRAGVAFRLHHAGVDYALKCPVLGAYNAENITAAFAMAHQAGIATDKIIDAIASFNGIKRRLEKRFEGEVTVIDAHAPTAEKAHSNLETLRELYQGKILAIYEPNIGGRRRESAEQYDFAFKEADEVYIPRLTKLKKSSEDEQPMEGDELADTISKTHKAVYYTEDDEELIHKVHTSAQKGDLIVFLGSHGFRGMIDEVIEKVR